MLPRPLPGFSLPLRSFSPASPARIASGLALALLAAGALNACASGSTAEVGVAGSAAPTMSASATPSATPTPPLSPELAKLREEALSMTEPERPELLAENTSEGAVTTAAYFLELYRYAFATGNTEPMESLSAETCTFCTNAIHSAEAIHEHGGWVDPWDQKANVAYHHEPRASREQDQVDLEYALGSITTREPDGSIRAQQDADPEARISVLLTYTGRSWRVEAAQPVENR